MQYNIFINLSHLVISLRLRNYDDENVAILEPVNQDVNISSGS